MIQRIKVNLEAIEALLYFWQATSEREKVSEHFIVDVASMPALTCAYDKEFDAESVRRALSAVTNREIFTSTNRKEGRFYNNNLWMMEDLEYTKAMIQPLKKLNLEGLKETLNNSSIGSGTTEIEVVFSPLHLDEYFVIGNKLVINFFRVKPGETADEALINDMPITDYIKEKLLELLSK